MKKLILISIFISSLLSANQMVSVSLLPQAYFVEKIAGDILTTQVMVPPGSSPATYEPKPSQMESLEKSKVYFAIGVPFERVWLPKFQELIKGIKIVHTDEGIEKQKIHEHSHDGVTKSGLDPHIWLDPILVKNQTLTMTNVLIEAFPEHKQTFLNNLKIFHDELDSLNEEVTLILSKTDRKKFMVFHPSWGYFSKRYDLTQISIEVEGKEPKPSMLASLIKKAKDEKIKTIFVSPAFSTKSAKTIAKEIKGEVVAIDPLAKDWKSELLKSARAIALSLEK